LSIKKTSPLKLVFENISKRILDFGRKTDRSFWQNRIGLLETGKAFRLETAALLTEPAA